MLHRNLTDKEIVLKIKEEASNYATYIEKQSRPFFHLLTVEKPERHTCREEFDRLRGKFMSEFDRFLMGVATAIHNMDKQKDVWDIIHKETAGELVNMMRKVAERYAADGNDVGTVIKNYSFNTIQCCSKLVQLRNKIVHGVVLHYEHRFKMPISTQIKLYRWFGLNTILIYQIRDDSQSESRVVDSMLFDIAIMMAKQLRIHIAPNETGSYYTFGGNLNQPAEDIMIHQLSDMITTNSKNKNVIFMHRP